MYSLIFEYRYFKFQKDLEKVKLRNIFELNLEIQIWNGKKWAGFEIEVTKTAARFLQFELKGPINLRNDTNFDARLFSPVPFKGE